MRHMKKTSLALFVFLLLATGLKAKHTISGVVISSVTKKPVPAVSVIVKQSSDGDFTNDHGNFKFSTSKKFPLTLVFSSIGYEAQEMVINAAQNSIRVELNSASTLGQEVVVSASRSTMKKL